MKYMPHLHDGVFVRSDIWREGQWLDLWSVVHLLSGISMGFIIYFFHFDTISSVILGFLLLVGYEMWEKIVGIVETPTNRFIDVVVGMVSFVPTYLSLAPQLALTSTILVFGFIFTANIVMAVFGWIASQKAAALHQHMRARIERERARLRKRAGTLRKGLTS